MSVAFSPGGDKLAYNSDFDVQLLDVASESASAPRSGHRGRIQKVLFRPNGRELLSCGDDRTVKIWPVSATNPQGSGAKPEAVTDASESRSLVGHTGRIQDMVLAPDGHTLPWHSFWSAELWELAASPAQPAGPRCVGLTLTSQPAPRQSRSSASALASARCLAAYCGSPATERSSKGSRTRL